VVAGVRPLLALAGTAVFAGAVYVLVVFGGSALLGTPSPNVALAVLATAVVAVTLEPVRRSLRRRLALSPYERLAAFGAGMAGAVATEHVAPRMARLIADATGARRVEVWLVDDEGETPAAAWPPAAEPVDRSAPGVRVHDVVDAAGPLGRIVRDQGVDGGLSPVEQRLVADLIGQAGLAVRSAGLAARLRRRIAEGTERAEQLRASRQRVVAAADAARTRIERDIHDGAQQHLVALTVRLRLARAVAERDPPRAAELLHQLEGAARDALATLGELSQGIHPRVLSESGVAAALRAAAALSPTPVHLTDATSGRAPADVEAAAYFSCLEAVQNAVKHAGATAVHVHLAGDADGWTFSVADDGRGFDPSAVVEGSGLEHMRDRVETAGGSLTVTSAPGAGTRVDGRIPVPSEAAS
jgi:signal transduction histidine kinase